jgi:chitinase
MVVLRSWKAAVSAVAVGTAAILVPLTHSLGGTAAAAEGPPLNTMLYVQSAANGSTLDLSGGHVSDGQRIVEWAQNSGRNQQWWVERSGDHHVIKSNVNGAFCLGRKSAANAAAIVLRRCDNALAAWDFVPMGGDKYKIKDPNAEQYMNVWDGQPSHGRELVSTTNVNYGSHWFLTDVNFRKVPSSGDKRLDEVTFLTAHNAHVNNGDSTWVVANQQPSIRKQLEYGVRGLQLDLHIYNHQVHLCHTSDSSCGWSPGIHYGFSRQPLKPVLETVVNFLNEAANRNEIVTIFFEDYVSPSDLQNVVDQVAGLKDLLFRGDAWAVKQNGWPKVADMVAQNKRLLLFSDRGDKESFGVMSGHDYTVENHWSMGFWGSNTGCYSRWGDVPLNKEEPGFRRLFVMNQFRDVASTIGANADNGDKLRGRAGEVCAAAARRKANFLAVDFVAVPSDNPRKVVAELNQ